jgi:hypothetical protein
MLVTAADVKLEVADPLSPALVSVTDFEEPSSFSERRILRAGATSLSVARVLLVRFISWGRSSRTGLCQGDKEIL